MQELICYRKNCIFVLPYVSLVQEKIRSLAPFALELGFYLEEYAGNRGRYEISISEYEHEKNYEKEKG